jgi:hypothetical protein
MLDFDKTRERELLLRRCREVDQTLGENQRALRALKKDLAARLPFETHLAFYLKEFLHSVKRS